jgi:hypothetical protein
MASRQSPGAPAGPIIGDTCVMCISLNKCVHVPEGKYQLKTLLSRHTLFDVFDDVHGGRPDAKLYQISATSEMRDHSTSPLPSSKRKLHCI